VLVQKDFNAGMDDGTGFKANLEMRKNKDISAEAIVESSIRYGYLPEDFDFEEDQKLLATEAENTLATTMVSIDPVTGKPLQQPIAQTTPPNAPPTNGGTPPPTRQ